MPSAQALLLAHNARTWGTRPSELLGLTEPLVALLIDDALALRLAQQQREDGAQPRADAPLPPGMRYERASDIDQPLYDAARANARRLAFEAKLRSEGVKVH